MKCPPIERLVYETMLPRPKPSDPQNFNGILTRFLVFEVRQEVHAFYGHLETPEARYPGLDYSNRTHRARLSRWPWHRRLFRAFDALGLTPFEIASLTKWEGTRWAKERFEKEQKSVIKDSAFDGLPDYREPGSRFCPAHAFTATHISCEGSSLPRFREDGQGLDRRQPERPEDPTQAAMRVPRAIGDQNWSASIPRLTIDLDENMDDVRPDNAARGGDEESDDGLVQSIGVQLNEQLRERVAAHNAGDTSMPLDEDWEQWLKNAMEAGNWNVVAEQLNRIAAQSPLLAQASPQEPLSLSAPSLAQPTDTVRPSDLTNIIPRDLLSAARAGHYDHVPDFVQEILRQTLDAERSGADSVAQPPAPSATLLSDSAHRPPDTLSAGWRRYSGLRLPRQ